MRPLLEVRHLGVRRGSTHLLQAVDWRVEVGQHWVILGANGSGKTSLLKALTGYLMPSSGEITLLGQRYGASDWRDLRRKIGVVTSAFVTAIPPAEPVLETVISGKYAQLDLWAAVTPADRRAAGRHLRTVGLGRLAGRPWSVLSQGERQRVLIARALMSRPRLLILDEPAAGLDPVARARFLALIQSLAARRARLALVLVTHHVEEIVPVFSHALLLRGGRVLAAGPRAKTLTSARLAETFAARVRLRTRGPGLSLDILADRG